MQEVIRLSAGIPPGPENPPVDCLETVQLEVRGPAGPVEGYDAERKRPGRPHMPQETRGAEEEKPRGPRWGVKLVG